MGISLENAHILKEDLCCLEIMSPNACICDLPSQGAWISRRFPENAEIQLPRAHPDLQIKCAPAPMTPKMLQDGGP